MAFTHRNTRTWGAGSTLIGADVNLTGTDEQNMSFDILPGVENEEHEIHLHRDTAVELFIISDQPIQITLNATGVSSAAGEDTGLLHSILLDANRPFAWDDLLPWPFEDSEITAMFFSNYGDTAANVELRSLIDA